jgi:hypothetical protein
MKIIKHIMSYGELSRLRDDRELVPILRSKGMPLHDDMLPQYGTLHWDDMSGMRTFIWEGSDAVMAPPPSPEPEPTPEPEVDFTSPVGRRAITFDE